MNKHNNISIFCQNSMYHLIDSNCCHLVANSVLQLLGGQNVPFIQCTLDGRVLNCMSACQGNSANNCNLAAYMLCAANWVNKLYHLGGIY